MAFLLTVRKCHDIIVSKLNRNVTGIIIKMKGMWLG